MIDDEAGSNLQELQIPGESVNLLDLIRADGQHCFGSSGNLGPACISYEASIEPRRLRPPVQF